MLCHRHTTLIICLLINPTLNHILIKQRVDVFTFECGGFFVHVDIIHELLEGFLLISVEGEDFVEETVVALLAEEEEFVDFVGVGDGGLQG